MDIGCSTLDLGLGGTKFEVMDDESGQSKIKLDLRLQTNEVDQRCLKQKVVNINKTEKS